MHEVLARLLAARVRRVSELYAEALFLDAETRVLRRLLELGALYGSGATAAVIPLSQQEIAGLAATSRATVNRVLRAEAARGSVELHRGQTTIADPVALAKRAGVPIAR
jgi:CRP-like cAMP-binding protein